jgi:hypothetical protein
MPHHESGLIVFRKFEEGRHTPKVSVATRCYFRFDLPDWKAAKHKNNVCDWSVALRDVDKKDSFRFLFNVHNLIGRLRVIWKSIE